MVHQNVILNAHAFFIFVPIPPKVPNTAKFLFEKTFADIGPTPVINIQNELGANYYFQVR